MSRLKCAVIGAGYLGKFHAEKYAGLPDCELVAVVDNNAETAQAIAWKHGVRALTDYQELLGKVDAVSIVVPTSLHYQVARDFLLHGAHVLVEKPITVTVEEADELIKIADEKRLKLMVGHLERFNAALLGMNLTEQKPLFIESHRLAPFNPRANDVSVVLDLMIHDIDIILDIVDSEVERIDAKGVTVLTSDTDIANARIVFKSGCVANVTASRASLKVERKMRLFMPNCYVSVDFQNRILAQYRKGEKEMYPGVPEIVSEEAAYENGDALLAEIQHFVDCIREDREPLVSGHAGRRALATAIAITELLKQD
ncbi:Gfo/Idh/MocA family oxidoreductase [Candidatus Methylospira mobilis]|uniref:Gfo/Idh/MocA family oxidoreductase n=1 Tax=Candidatus Methylospira mobilis TaxID=1808979 RepID=A0A5Q0BJD3_9GAMM|nr:Gfo/Idh/MocA family oxidoreductase [Candidatus Methylospira mobilis]QFY43985.1 Gfo/Idh/MocA family oxidoreductase [Candidatus Methylospira mobilis]WNV04985.1 Gfo/Idh/MocA family oxidoreductase [Candidatus Methylospira mobilis]